MVAVVEGERLVGFAQLQSDGEIQAHLSLIAETTSSPHLCLCHAGRRELFGAFGPVECQILAIWACQQAFDGLSCQESGLLVFLPCSLTRRASSTNWSED